MFHSHRMFVSLLIVAIVALSFVFTLADQSAFAQDGGGQDTRNILEPIPPIEPVAVAQGLPALYACKYGNWGCILPNMSVDSGQTVTGLPALYASKYGNWDGE